MLGYIAVGSMPGVEDGNAIIPLLALITAFNASSVISAIATAISFGFATTMAPFILCIWWKPLNRTGGYSGIAAGFTSFVFFTLMYPNVAASFVGFWVSLVGAVAVSLLTQKKDPPKVLTKGDGTPMDLSNRLGTLPLFRRVD